MPLPEYKESDWMVDEKKLQQLVDEAFKSKPCSSVERFRAGQRLAQSILAPLEAQLRSEKKKRRVGGTAR